MMSGDGGDVCPSCRLPFDSNRKRRLVDACGHERCYSCIFTSDLCLLCLHAGEERLPDPSSVLTLQRRSRLKTNGHFSSKMLRPHGRSALSSSPARTSHAVSVTSRAEIHHPRPTSSSLAHSSSSPSIGSRLSAPPALGGVHHSLSGGAIAGTDCLTSSTDTIDSALGPELASTLTRLRHTTSIPEEDERHSQQSFDVLEAGRNSALLADNVNMSGSSADSVLENRDRSIESVSSLLSSSTGVSLSPQGSCAWPQRKSQRSLNLSPIAFEIPYPEQTPLFIGRQWLFAEMKEKIWPSLQGDREIEGRGVVLIGTVGSGKTSILRELVEHSCFGHSASGIHEVESGNLYLEPVCGTASLCNLGDGSYEALHWLGAHIAALHFCQADNNVTCLVPEMVHSLSAYLSQCPQLVAYKEFLLSHPEISYCLSIKRCIEDPASALMAGIIEPLHALTAAGIFQDLEPQLILIDSLDEAEFHKSDYGDTLASFLTKHTMHFPSWLKLLITIRSEAATLAKLLPLAQINLITSAHHSEDLHKFVTHRIGSSLRIRNNVAEDAGLRLAKHIQMASGGSFLYTKLLMDLIERGTLVLKSANLKTLPRTLPELFLLLFNLRFPTQRAYDKVAPILNVALASLFPLNARELFDCLNSGFIDQSVPWSDFLPRLDLLRGLLVERQDNTLMYFHPAFREWLTRREHSGKFVCDLRQGHALLSFKMSRLDAPLGAQHTIELAHHILKAHIYKNVSRSLTSSSSRDLHAYWLCVSARSLSAALASHHNLFTPNIKVSRLILLAGANPNVRTECLGGSPVLSVAAACGYLQFVATLLEFGANIDQMSRDGSTALHIAAARGHLQIVKLLLEKGAPLATRDNNGLTPLANAAANGQLDIMSFLLQTNWSDQNDRDAAIQQALCCACSCGHRTVVEYLLNMSDSQNFDRLNAHDSISSETPLTAACLHSQYDIVNFLLKQGANIKQPNATGFLAIHAAARAGHEGILRLLLNTSMDLIDVKDSRQLGAYIHAAANGHVKILAVLREMGVNSKSHDDDGHDALCWSVIKNQRMAIESLIANGSDVKKLDKKGRTLLHLAACYTDGATAQFLLEKGADLEHTDNTGMRALEAAIAARNTETLVCFLRKGAKLGGNTWLMASGKLDILFLLLNKLMEDGNILYKKGRLKDAAHRYQYALRKFPNESDRIEQFRDLQVNMCLNLSRCKRKLNESSTAVELASKALQLNPKSFEALYARARAQRDEGKPQAALHDLMAAIRLQPSNSELQKLYQKIAEEAGRVAEPPDIVPTDNTAL